MIPAKHQGMTPREQAMLLDGSDKPRPVLNLARNDMLIDRERLEAMRSQILRLDTRLDPKGDPQSRASVEYWINYLIGAVVVPKDTNRDMWLRHAGEVLAGAPADIAKRAVMDLADGSKYLPSRAEIVAAIDGHKVRRAALLRAIEAQLAEHRRRDAEKSEAPLPSAEERAINVAASMRWRRLAKWMEARGRTPPDLAAYMRREREKRI